jgi:hypothetical protein
VSVRFAAHPRQGVGQIGQHVASWIERAATRDVAGGQVVELQRQLVCPPAHAEAVQVLELRVYGLPCNTRSLLIAPSS